MFGELLGFSSQLLDVGKTALEAYSVFSTLNQGRTAEKTLDYLERQSRAIERQAAAVERLSENLFFAPRSSPSVVTKGLAKTVNLRDVRDLLAPIQKSTGGIVLASAPLFTPRKLQREMAANAWLCLDDPRPYGKHTAPPSPDHVALYFPYEGIAHTGWLKIGALRALFDIDLNRTPEGWTPRDIPAAPHGGQIAEKSRARHLTGTVKFWRREKNYGFIVPTGGGDDVFVHLSEIKRIGLTALNEGQLVSFEVGTGPQNRPIAINLSIK